MPRVPPAGLASVNEATPHPGKFIHPHVVFTLFKWLVYGLLAWNAVQFLQEDLAASAETFGGTMIGETS